MSSDDKEAKRAEQLKKRGSRAWLAEKLNAIEALGGIGARQVAADRWASLVWHNPHEAAFAGADAVEQIHTLSTVLQKIQDPAAAARIEEIIHSGDDEKIKKTSEGLGGKRIKKAVQMQTLTEERICEMARPYCMRENPTGHLKARRFLRREAKQSTALLNMHLGLIGSDGHHHVTPHELQMRNQQKERWRKFGESVTLTRDDESISMLTAMQAAGKKKLAEIYTLTKGLESYAKAAGLTWAFLTLTAPPRMHPNPGNGHSTWDGTTPDVAHEWIHNAYHKTEAWLRTTHGIIISGLRVVEPHKDGAPHWHVLIFAHSSEMATIEAAFRRQPEWKSAQGFKFMPDDGTASAATYCFKYVLDTVNSIEQLYGENGTVDAWRSTWGIRSFQFFGMPPMGLWRNLRAAKECPAEPLLAGLWRAAHRGDGHAFIGLAGGLNVKSKDRPVTSRTTGDDKTKSIEFVLQDTGESIKFNFKKWQQSKVTDRKLNKDAVLEVILNYPRKAKTEPKPIEFAYAAATGDDPLYLIERGRTPHSRLPSPSILPHLSHVGRASTHHGTGALVGALQPRLPSPWWTDVNMTKAPSLTQCYDHATGELVW